MRAVAKRANCLKDNCLGVQHVSPVKMPKIRLSKNRLVVLYEKRLGSNLMVPWDFKPCSLGQKAVHLMLAPPSLPIQVNFFILPYSKDSGSLSHLDSAS